MLMRATRRSLQSSLVALVVLSCGLSTHALQLGVPARATCQPPPHHAARAASVSMGLLKGIPPLLSADMLYVLRSMGHGDKLAIVDCNFPAAECATKTTSGKKIELAVDLPTALDAICAVLPLDFFIESPAAYMAPQEGVALPPLGAEVTEALKSTIVKHCPGVKISPLERFSFYDEARSCYAVVQVLERRPYGNVVLTKGVVGPDGKDLIPDSA